MEGGVASIIVSEVQVHNRQLRGWIREPTLYMELMGSTGAIAKGMVTRR